MIRVAYELVTDRHLTLWCGKRWLPMKFQLSDDNQHEFSTNFMKRRNIESKAFYSRRKLWFVSLVANAAAYTHWKCMICPKMHILDVHSPHSSKIIRLSWGKKNITHLHQFRVWNKNVQKKLDAQNGWNCTYIDFWRENSNIYLDQK